MFLLFLTCWIAVFVVLIIKKREVLVNPLFWLGMASVFITGMYYTSGFNYNYPLRISGLVYYIGLTAVFVLGFEGVKMLSPKVPALQKANAPQRLDLITGDSEKNERFLYTYINFAISAVGFLLFIIDFFIHNSLTSANLHTESQISTIGVLGKIMLLSGLTVWLYELVFAISHNKKISPVAYLAAVFYMVPALLTSGRQSMLILILSTFVAFFFALIRVKHYKYIKTVIILISAATVALVIFCVLVAVFRQQTSDKKDVFEQMFSCEISSTTANILDKLAFLKSLVLEVVAYYSHELPMFQLFFDNWNGGLFFGLSQLTVISQTIPQKWALSYESLWEIVQAIADKYGVFSHTWRTGAANFVIDFGFVGAFFAALISGFICGYIYLRCKKSNSCKNAVLFSVINAGLFFSIQYSPVGEGFWFYPMCWLFIGIPVTGFVLTKCKKRFPSVFDKFESVFNKFERKFKL